MTGLAECVFWHVKSSAYQFHDTKVVHSAIAEGSQCFLLCGALVSGHGLLDDRNHDAVLEPSLEGGCGRPARKTV
jgi:hypothetical protein